MSTKLTLASVLLLFTIHCGAQAQTAKADPQAPENAARTAVIASLNTLAAQQTAARREAVAKVTTKAAALQRQAEVRRRMLALIGGLPERTPLNAKVTGTVPLDGFHIEKLTYESQPGFHVTALLYLPDGVKGRLPAIVVAPGHGATGKASDFGFASTFARNGFAVLSYDPLGQGERLQYPDPANPGKTLQKGPTGEHGEAGLQPVLIGESVAKYMLWDGMRAVDYLQSRPEIDPARIGAFGCSGGGAMTALLGALDTRIAATGTACYITSFDALLGTIGPQDGEQSTPGWIAAGLDFPDWVEVAAPRPYAVIATASDMFPYAGARASVAEARRFYGLFDAASLGSATGAPEPGVPTGPVLNPDTANAVSPDARLQFIAGIGGHGNLRPLQGQIVSFFLRQLAHSDAAPVLPPPPAPGASPFALPAGVPKDAFQVTATGQVATSFPVAETVYSLNLKRARTLPHPRSLSLKELQAAIRTVTGVGAELPHDPKGKWSESALGVSEVPASMWDWEPAPGVHLRARFTSPFVPGAGRHPARLILDGGPEGSEPVASPNASTTLAKTGLQVMNFTPRPSPVGSEELKSPLLGSFYLLGLRAELTGKTLLGLRVEDVMYAVDSLAARSDDVTAEASGHEALVLLHAAVLDPRLKHVTLTHLPPSYRELLANPMPVDAPQDVLPGVLLHYDVPDLVRALGTRVTVVP